MQTKTYGGAIISNFDGVTEQSEDRRGKREDGKNGKDVVNDQLVNSLKISRLRIFRRVV